MENNVVPFKKGKMSKPHKLRLTQVKGGPILETTVAENAVIQKFIKYAMRDLLFQIEIFKKANLPEQDLENKIRATNFLIEYYKITLYEIEKGIY